LCFSTTGINSRHIYIHLVYSLQWLLSSCLHTKARSAQRLLLFNYPKRSY